MDINEAIKIIKEFIKEYVETLYEYRENMDRHTRHQLERVSEAYGLLDRNYDFFAPRILIKDKL